MDIFQNIIIFVIGAMFGSAANALSDRLPRNESWFAGRSHCDKCGHVLGWKDLIPIFSYVSLAFFDNAPSNPPLKLRGGRDKNLVNKHYFGARCRYCRSPIPYRNLLVEIFLGVGFAFIISHVTFNIFQAMILMGMLWVTTIIAVMDWESKLVSEVMVGVWAALVAIFQFSIFNFQSILKFSNFQNNLLGLLIGVGVIGGLWAVTRGKAMGFGDVEIAAVMGWWLAWPKIGPALWIAFVSGAVVGSWQLVVGKKKLKSEIAFGPFLVLGAWAGWLWGDRIIRLLGY